jgi:hypothetical protein
MNMTIVIVSKRSVELLVLLLAVVGFVGPSALTVEGATVDAGVGSPTTNAVADDDDIPETMRVIADDSKLLDGEVFEQATKDFARHLSKTMDKEMAQLIREMGASDDDASSGGRELRETDANRKKRIDKEKLDKIMAANRAARENIRARIELVGDNSGNLPQMSFAGAVNSLASVVEGRLVQASSYVDNTIRSLGEKVAGKIPAKLAKYFRWTSFLQFKIRYNKRYSSLREELYKHFTWLGNWVSIRMQNFRFHLHYDDFILGQTQYSDMTEKEYLKKTSNKAGGIEHEDDELKSIDPEWRQKLKQLAASNKNMYGLPIDEVKGDKSSSNDKKAARRKKREADNMETGDNHEVLNESKDEDIIDEKGEAVNMLIDDNYDELNESEDEDIIDNFAFGDIDLDKLNDRAIIDDNEMGDMKDLVEFIGEGASMSDIEKAANALMEHLRPEDFQSVDLRETGCIIKPENQEDCGACYAYVTSALVSYHDCMARKQMQAAGHELDEKPLRRFHAHFISNCGKYMAPDNHTTVILNGCAGGRVGDAFEFCKKVGIPLFRDYNMAQAMANILSENPPDRCVDPRPKNIFDKSEWSVPLKEIPSIQRFQRVPISTSDVNMHLRTVGPVLLNIRAWTAFKDYKAGIFDHIYDMAGKPVNYHSMLIVGHTRDPKGREMYIVWNSHGTPWGNDGYLWITAEALDHYKQTTIGTLPDTI